MKKFICILLLCFVVVGCATSAKKLQKINLYMTKDEVVGRIGNPTVVRGSITNKFRQIIEVLEYRMDKGKTGKQIGRELTITALTFGLASPLLLSEGEIQDYWLYFSNGKLVRWGQAGDWGKEADRIYEINFDVGPKLSR